MGGEWRNELTACSVTTWPRLKAWPDVLQPVRCAAWMSPRASAAWPLPADARQSQDVLLAPSINPLARRTTLFRVARHTWGCRGMG